MNKKEKKKLKTLHRKAENEKHKEWADAVKERDKYVCQICGKSLKDGNVHNIQAHHILAKTTYPELKYDINNGLTLCYFDHKNSKFSPHLNGFSFTEIFKQKFPERYEYLLDMLREKWKQS